MRYAYAITGALLLGGAAASMTLAPAGAQTAQNEPSIMQQVAPPGGAPMSFANMVARLQPAVVNVSTTQHVKVPNNPFAGTPFGDLFGQMNGLDGGGGGTTTRPAESLGSGFLISPDGYVVTNNHVISAGAQGATVDSIKVTLTDGKEYDAKLIGHDDAADLAVLKINGGPFPYVKFGDSKDARVGDWVIAIGNPFGIGSTVTQGIISALHRTTGLGGGFDRFIQTDASINRGNSGGPMFDMHGNVIGINSQILSPSGGNIGIGFAIPAEEAAPVVQTLMHGGTVQRGYLGVQIQPVTSDIASALGLPDTNSEIIAQVVPGQAGDKAGLKAGDVVTAVNGQNITQDQSLSYLVGNIKPGQTVQLTVVRKGAKMTIPVTLGKRPPESQIAGIQGDDDNNDGLPDQNDQSSQQATADTLGVSVVPLTPQIAQSVGVDSSVRGVVVTDVDQSSDAGSKLQRGVVIQAVNGVPVTTAAALAAQVTAAQRAGRTQVLLYVALPHGQNIFVPVGLKTAKK